MKFFGKKPSSTPPTSPDDEKPRTSFLSRFSSAPPPPDYGALTLLRIDAIDDEVAIGCILDAKKGGIAHETKTLIQQVLDRQGEQSVKDALEKRPKLKKLVNECSKDNIAAPVAGNRYEFYDPAKEFEGGFSVDGAPQDVITTYEQYLCELSRQLHEVLTRDRSDEATLTNIKLSKQAATLGEIREQLNSLKRDGYNMEALMKAKEAVDEFPNDPELYMFLANLAIESGKYQEALDAWKKAFDLSANTNFDNARLCMLNIGSTYDIIGKSPEEVLSLQFELWIKKGRGLEDSKEYKSALTIFKEALKIAQANNDISKQEEVELHIKYLEVSPEDRKRCDILINKANEDTLNGNFAEALEHWEAARRISYSSKIAEVCQTNIDTLIKKVRVSNVPPPRSGSSTIPPLSASFSVTGKISTPIPPPPPGPRKSPAPPTPPPPPSPSGAVGRSVDTLRPGPVTPLFREAPSAPASKKLVSENDIAELFESLDSDAGEHEPVDADELVIALEVARHRINKNEREINRLSEELNSETERADNLVQLLEDAEKNIKKTEQIVLSAHSENDALILKLDAAIERAETAEMQLKEEEMERERAAKILEERDILLGLFPADNTTQANNILEKLYTDLETVNVDRDTFLHERDTLFSLLGAGSLNEAMDNLDKLKIEMGESASRIRALNLEITSVKADLDSQGEELTKMDEEKREAFGKVAEFETKIQELQEKLSGLESQLETEKRHAEAETRRADELQSQLEQAQQSAQQAGEESERNESELKSRFETEKQRADELQQEVNRVKSELHNANQRGNDEEVRADGLQKEVDRLNGELESVNQRFNKEKVTVDELKEQLKKMHESTQKAKEEHKQTVSQLQSDINNANQRAYDENRRANALQAEFWQAQEDVKQENERIISDLQLQLEATNQRVDAEKQRADGLQKEVDRLNGELESVNQYAQQLENNIQELRTSYEDLTNEAGGRLADLEYELGSVTRRAKKAEEIQDMLEDFTEEIPALFEPRTVKNGERIKIGILTASYPVAVDNGGRVVVEMASPGATIILKGENASRKIIEEVGDHKSNPVKIIKDY